jgi:hypothetical protein
MPPIRTDPRTHYEAVLDIGYAIQWNALNERLFRRLDAAIKIIMLFFSTTAVGGYLASSPRIAAFSALLLAFLTIFDVVISPGRKVCEFNEAQRRFTELEGKAPQLKLPDLEREIRTLRAQHTTPGISGLSTVAYNQNVRSNGRLDSQLASTAWERFLESLV